MKWIKIEEGCEMPDDWNLVLVCCRSNSEEGNRYVCTATAIDGGFMPHDEQIQFGKNGWQETPTHWTRVELPEE